MKKILIIGARGYLGQKIFSQSETLEKQGWKVQGTSSQSDINMLHLNLINPSEFDYNNIDSDSVILLSAAISAPDICANQHDYAWQVNVEGTTEFIRTTISQGGKVIFFSSDTVYGEQKSNFNEETKCNPSGEYAIMKHEIEERFKSSSLFKSIRLSYIFSRQDKFTKYLYSCTENNNVAELFHPFYRSVVYRNDVVEGVINLATKWGETPQQIINFGGPEVLSKIDIAQHIKQEALTGLEFSVIEPSESFFKNRPRIIAMSSPIFSTLLGRNPLKLTEAIKVEFSPLTK